MKNVFVRTFGCSANFAEGEMIKGVLAGAGFCIVDSDVFADVVVLNVCTVKGYCVALRAVKTACKNLEGKKLVIAGCIPDDFVALIEKIVPNVSFISTHNVHKIADAVSKSVGGLQVKMLGRVDKYAKVSLPRIKNNPAVGIVCISEGCVSACAFCSVKFIKGMHKSYAVDDIVKLVNSFVKDGCKEIWITGQDVGCYGVDISSDLPVLLERLVLIDGDFKIRLGMANPEHVKNYVERLISVFRSDKMFKFLHIPLQSGNDAVLRNMRRNYCAGDVRFIVQRFRAVFQNFCLSTDIICGFPGETDAQFADTLSFVDELKFDVVNISRFIARSGTVAAKMKGQISSNVLKVRSKEMSFMFRKVAFEQNKLWVDWSGEIIIDEQGRGDVWFGRNFAYKLVVVKGGFCLGQKVNIKIIGCASTFLKGVIV